MSVNPSFSSAVLQFLISSAERVELPVMPTEIPVSPVVFFTSVNICVTAFVISFSTVVVLSADV